MKLKDKKSMSTSVDHIFSGWLSKAGKIQKANWKRRFFVLTIDYLLFFKDDISKKASGGMPAKTLAINNMNPVSDTIFFFVTYDERLKVKSESVEEKNQWFDAIKRLQRIVVSRNRTRASVTSSPPARSVPPRPLPSAPVHPNVPPPVPPPVHPHAPPPVPPPVPQLSPSESETSDTERSPLVKEKSLPSRPKIPQKVPPEPGKKKQADTDDIPAVPKKELPPRPKQNDNQEFLFRPYKMFRRFMRDAINSNPKKRAQPSGRVDLPKQSGESSAKKINSMDLSEMNTLNAILDDEIGKEYFFKYLASEYCEFQLSFWLMVRSLVRLIESEEEKQFPQEGRKEILKLSIRIIEDFVVEGMETTVNIGENLRRPLLKWNELALKIIETEEVFEWEIDYTSKIFEDVAKIYQKAQYDVFKMLRGSYRRFKKNLLFDELQEALVRSNNDHPSEFISTRGSCARSNCKCEIYVDNEKAPMKSCVGCNHFYEEHVNLSTCDSLETRKVSEDKKAGAVSSDQRRKLQLLLGKSFANVDQNTVERNSRREFLIKNIAAIVYNPPEPLKMKSVRVYLKKYKKCFTARDLIKKLQKRLSLSKRETVNIATEMMDLGLISPVDKSQAVFMEGKFFYRFAKDVTAEIESMDQVELADSGADESEEDEEEEDISSASGLGAVNMLDMLMAFHGPTEAADEKTEKVEKAADKAKKKEPPKKSKDSMQRDAGNTESSKSKFSLKGDPFYDIYQKVTKKHKVPVAVPGGDDQKSKKLNAKPDGNK